MNIGKEYSQDKIFLHMDKVNSFMKGENSSPVVIETNITNVCNAKCVWCSEEGYRSCQEGKAVEREAMLSALKEMGAIGVKAVVFEGGGEPTVHPNFNEFIVASNKANLDVGLITNGMRLAEAGVIDNVEKFNFIRVSFDAGDREVYSKLHGVNAQYYDKILEEIALVADARNEKKANTIIGMSFIVTEANIASAYEFALRAKSAGVDYVQFKAEIFENSFRIPFAAQQKMEAIQEDFEDEHFKVFIVRLDGSACDGKKDYTFCYAHRFIGALTANGEVQLCCNLKHMHGDDYSFGNIHEKSFIEIWGGKQRQDLIDLVEKDPDFVSTHCGQCRMDNINRLFSWANDYKDSPLKNFI